VDAVRPADEAARRGDWATYFQLLKEEQGDGGAEQVPQPPAEHRSTDPWPDDFVAPPVVVKARLMAEARGWEVRLGYSRAYLKTGRGHVRANGSGARWTLHHFVQIGVRRRGSAGLSDAWIIYRQDVGGTGWTAHGAGVQGTDANVTAWRSFVESLEVES
jgi:hypothetical protein